MHTWFHVEPLLATPSIIMRAGDFEWIFCVHFFLFFSVSLSSNSRYRYHYGNVLTELSGDYSSVQELVSNDIIKFVAIKLEVPNNKLVIIKFQKKLQYHSDDGAMPTKLNYMNNKMCYSVIAQIATMYDIEVSNSGTIHKFTIIEDKNDLLKIYSYIRHQQLDQLLPPLCRKLKLFADNNIVESCDATMKCLSDVNEFDWSKVTIATYNIWNINSTTKETHRKRITRLAESLSSFDIIGLQEVRSVSGDWKGSSINQIEVIRKVLPEHQYVYQPGMLFTHNKRDEEGVAIMSRFPILSTDYILLPWNRSDPSDFHQRVCLQCTIQTPMGKINVFVTHLSLSESAQISSVVEIYHFMGTFFGPSILLGDLNAEPHSPPIRFLSGELKLNGIQAYRIFDLWKLFEYQNGETFCSLQDKPEKRIDFIFLKDTGNICIESVDVIGTTRHPPLSDHFGLSSTFRIK